MMKTTTHILFKAMDQGENGILVFALYYKIYEDDEEYYSYPSYSSNCKDTEYSDS